MVNEKQLKTNEMGKVVAMMWGLLIASFIFYGGIITGIVLLIKKLI